MVFHGRLSHHGRQLAEALARTTSSPSLPTPHQTFNLDTDLVDLRGKVAIVTGGNRGNGFATVRHLLRAGIGRVYIAARDERRANEAMAALHEEGLGLGGDSESEVIWLRLSLSDPRDAWRAAEEFMRIEDRLDIIGEFSSNIRGPDGVSMIQIVNYISPYIFTKKLLPLLTRTAREPDSDVRIVNIAPKAHRLVPQYHEFKSIEDFNIKLSPCSFEKLHQYGNAKLAMILWSRHLQRQLASTDAFPNGITVIALHPGASVVQFTVGIQKAITSFVAASPEVGSQTIMFAAAARKVVEERDRYQTNGGVYLVDTPVPGSVRELGKQAKDVWLMRDLIQTTERFLEQIGL